MSTFTFSSLPLSFSNENSEFCDNTFENSTSRKIYSDDLSQFLNDLNVEAEAKKDTSTLDPNGTLGFPVRSSTPIITSISTTTREDEITPYSPNQFLKIALGGEVSTVSSTFVLNAQATSATNALNWCKTRPEFVYSRERVEAERIWLLANRRCEQVQRVNSPKNNELDNRPKGSLMFDNISLPLKADKTLQASNYWYLVEFSVDQQVLMTNASSGVAVYGSDGRPRVTFPADDFHFQRLAQDFDLQVRVYQLNLIPTETRGRLFSWHQPKTQARKWFELMSARSGFLRWVRSIRKSAKESSPPPSESSVSSVSGGIGDFTHIAHASFGLKHLISGSKLTLEKVRPSPLIVQHFSAECVLEGSLDACVQSSIHLGNTTNHMGFVNYAICSNQGVIRHWERVWCILDDGLMRFWYYPNIVDYAAPVYTIDLNRSLLRRISNAIRSNCPRKRTLVVITCQVEHISQTHECQPKKYFLSIDKEDELQKWVEKIDLTLGALQAWQLDSQCQRFASEKTTD